MKLKVVLCLAFICLPAVWANAEIKISADAQTRLRYEYLGNNSLLDDRSSYFRFRFSGGLKADFEKFYFYGKLTTESRSYIYNSGKDARYNIDEAVIDNLFIFAPDIFGFEITAGRFDLNPAEYGEGFLIADGTPLDGSRTSYFNALRARYKTGENSFDFLGIYNVDKDGLPVINSKDKALNSSDETAAAVFGRIKKEDCFYLEPYYIFKRESGQNYDNNINTLGAFFKTGLNFAQIRAQAALQLGDYGGKSSTDFGGYLFADFPIAEIVKPLSLGYIYLSGGGDDNAGWNPLFSRYPWQSEILATLYAQETRRPGYWTNLQILKVEASASPCKKTSIKASCSYLFADKIQTGAFFGGGKDRGVLAACKISFDVSKNIKTYLLGEYFAPGDFYARNKERSTFVRAELSAKI